MVIGSVQFIVYFGATPSPRGRGGGFYGTMAERLISTSHSVGSMLVEIASEEFKDEARCQKRN